MVKKLFRAISSKKAKGSPGMMKLRIYLMNSTLWTSSPLRLIR